MIAIGFIQTYAGVSSFKPKIPATIRAMHPSRMAPAGSPSMIIPAIAVPTVPMQAHAGSHRNERENRRPKFGETLRIFQPDGPADFEQSRSEQINPRHQSLPLLGEKV
jgi:hypothetical protein